MPDPAATRGFGAVTDRQQEQSRSRRVSGSFNNRFPDASQIVIMPDYVVVGAGSAGCVVARRLVDAGARVLLVEAGGTDNHFHVSMPAAFTLAIGSDRFDWGFVSEPEPGLLSRRIPAPRGKVVGGSSSINAMAFVRGQAEDFDNWAQNYGLSDWSYAQCLPYFRKLEKFSGGASEFRGGGGLFNVTRPAMRGMLDQAFLRAAGEAGHCLADDTNAKDQEGFGPMDQSIHLGRRESAASAYLSQIVNSENLEIHRHSIVSRVSFDESRRAVSVHYCRDGQEYIAKARREVILCAGAFGSPQILMHSGIGPAAHLRDLGIGIVSDRREVGENLQDHVDVTCSYLSASHQTVSGALRWYRKPFIFLEWLARKRGVGATNHFEVAGYIRSSAQVHRPDIQIAFIPLLYEPQPLWGQTRHGFQATIMALRPKSRGRLLLSGRDPGRPPSLCFRYLEHEHDIIPLRDGIRRFREIVRQPAFAAYAKAEHAPGEAVSSDDELDLYIRRSAKSTHHPCGTCRMGIDEGSVVDAVGKVRGVDGLRVIDASIMPEITSGNINAPTLMIAEKMAHAMVTAG